MKVNLYDFDDTIYAGNSPLHFFIFCFKKRLIKFSHFIRIIYTYLQYKIKKINYTQLHENILSAVQGLPDIDALIAEFWQDHKKNIKAFYLNKQDKSNDIIITASPEFLINPIAEELGVKAVIGSDVDKKTGLCSRPMCRGIEKVKEFEKKYPKAIIVEAYGNSKHDIPYLELAEKSFMVKKNKVHNYAEYKPNILVRFWNWGWGIYHKNEEVWNYLIIGGLTTVISIGTYILFGNMLSSTLANFEEGVRLSIINTFSWLCAVIFAYFTNRWFVFHSKNQNKLKEAASFIGSRVFTYLLETGLLILLVELLLVGEITAKVMGQIVVLISNYIISKLLVFKKEER